MAVAIVSLPTVLSRGGGDSGGRPWIELALAAVVLALGVISWLVTRWRIEGATLRIETGLIKRSSLRFPLVQVQAIDVVRPLLARVFGLAELRLRMGGSTGRSARLAYLTEPNAEEVRARLLGIARGLAAPVSAGVGLAGQASAPTEPSDSAPADRIIVSVPPSRLIASIMLSRLGVTVEAVIVALIATAATSPGAAGAVVGTTAVLIVALVRALWQRFNGEYDLTVTRADEGLHLRAGLLETTAETILWGRVQAVRMIEPLLWRPFGWCRVQVAVAGRQRTEGESQAASRSLRAVLPVGSRADARSLLDLLVPDAPAYRLPAPSRARLKSPLRYHYLSWARTDSIVATTSGRVSRVTDWVPLAKVQSLRWTQGPVQRRLRLATIHLDTAGRSVHAAIRDRDTTEIDHVFGELIVLARSARQASRGARPKA